MNALALQINIPNTIAEYEEKLENIPALIENFEGMVEAVKLSTTISGTYVGSTPSIWERDAKAILLQSAWRRVYEVLNIKTIASAIGRFDPSHARSCREQLYSLPGE